MEPAPIAFAGLALGAAYAAVALRVERRAWAPVRKHAQDFYVMGWWALAASAFLSGAGSALVWARLDDLAVNATVRLGVVLAFVLAIAAFLAAAGHIVTANAAVKSAAPRRRAS